MNDAIELLKEIKNKLDRIDERLSRYENEELETITLEELKKELEIDDEL